MAQQTTVRLVDDIDGNEAHETVTFGLDGKYHEIDLSTDNAKRLRELVAPFVDKARKAGSAVAKATGAKMTVSGTRSRTEDRSREETAAIREWARGNMPDVNVSDRGRIPRVVLEAYANRPLAKPTTAPVFASAGQTETAQPKGKATSRKASQASKDGGDTANPKGSTGTSINADDLTTEHLVAYRESNGLPLTKNGKLSGPMKIQTMKLMKDAGLIH